MDGGGWKAEVPIAGECLWWGKGSPSVVDRGKAEGYVAAEDEGGYPYFVDCQYKRKKILHLVTGMKIKISRTEAVKYEYHC